MMVKLLIKNSIDELSKYKRKLIAQASIIKEYENWTHILLNIVNTSKSLNKTEIHSDYATPIQKVTIPLIKGTRKNRTNRNRKL